jgi:hypothetical protein
MNDRILHLGDVSPQRSGVNDFQPAARGTGVGDMPLQSESGEPAKNPVGTQSNRAGTAPVEAAEAQGSGAGSKSERSEKLGDGASRNATPQPASSSVSDNDRGRRLTRDRGPARRGNAGLWTAVVLLSLALIGVSAYSYSAFKRNSLTVAQLPGMRGIESSLVQRLNATEGTLLKLTNSSQGLSAQLNQIDHKVGSMLGRTREQTEQLVAQAENRMEGRMNERDQALEARLARVESGRNEDRDRAAEMQKEVDGVKKQVAQDDQDAWRQLSELNQRSNENVDRMNELDRSMHQPREKVTFEASRQAVAEIVPGISFTVTDTNTAYQRFNGYLTLADASRTVRLRDVAAQQSVTFYAGHDPQAFDLVVTSINSGGVAGFLVMPAGGTPTSNQDKPSAASASAANDGTAGVSESFTVRF